MEGRLPGTGEGWGTQGYSVLVFYKKTGLTDDLVAVACP